MRFDSSIKHIVFDGTHFGKKHCLIVFLDYETMKPIYWNYVAREGYKEVKQAAETLAEGLGVVTPICCEVITMLAQATADVWIKPSVYHT
ncbi:hypothetical protein AGMMS50229_13020 [Campylobacterota bacterium]|nr:hypothetical protein AGMMS50229_13020 [Campylobacterota bacterium]